MGMCHEIFWVLFWHVWIDLGLYKNLWLFLIFSVEPLILCLCLTLIRAAGGVYDFRNFEEV